VEMTRAGLSEDLIISTVRSRGGRFDLSPAGLITLKQQGVSDRVVLAAQAASTGGGYAPAASGYAPAPAMASPVVVGPPVYYVRPAPIRVYYGHSWGHGHYHHGHGHGHHHW
jgi:hypothetical protein